MKKVMYLSLVCAALLQASEVNLEPIAVESTRISDVSGEEIKSADLAEALTKKIPSISLVRRSGIANDIILRGQKKDNINILTDGTKVYGACPNRMDPATSHILTNNIESVEITEGPYDVENFGTLSGAIKIETRKPSEEINGEINLNLGSNNYRKLSTTLSGGTKRVKLLISASTEQSGQYKDGNGDTLAQQLENATADTSAHYQDAYKEMDAYKKKTVMGKLFFDITDNQELRLSYTANRSDDILYPSSKMDAIFDDSDIYNIEYKATNLGSFSKAFDIQLYQSEVEHPMSTLYRNSSGTDSVNEVISALSTKMQGARLKNSLDLTDSTELTIGLDASKRNWDGTYTGYGTKAGISGRKGIDDVDTNNMALFTELEQNFSNLNLKFGARFDDTTIEPTGDVGQPSNDYTALSANLFATYQATPTMKIFGGAGKASRVPDARELYFQSSMNVEGGTPTLDQTTNYEVDLGMENSYENFTIKTKLFYSMLKDYIYFNANNKKVIMMMGTPMTAGYHSFENIDATIYGLDITASYYATDTAYFDFGLAYQRGQKDEALTGSVYELDGSVTTVNQTSTNLAEIPPLKGRVALNYDYDMGSKLLIELLAARNWSEYDSDNGEQGLAGYAVLNLKETHAFNNNISLTVGIDNVFDVTYATTNTYRDLTLITTGAGVDDVMLINEPGRYFYMNATYTF